MNEIVEGILQKDPYITIVCNSILVLFDLMFTIRTTGFLYIFLYNELNECIN